MKLLDPITHVAGSVSSELPQRPDFSGDLAELLEGCLSQDTRLLGLHTSAECGITDNTLLVHRIHGTEAINELFRYEIQVLSTDAFMELKSMQGVPTQVTILTDKGHKRCLNGVVTAVRSEGTDGALASYRLILEPVVAALRLSRSSRVFLGKTDLDIVLLLLQEEQANNSVFSACLNLDNRCHGNFPVREFAYQCDESTWSFIERRLAKIGVSYVIVPTQDGSPDIPQQTLILFNDPNDLDENEARAVRFHRADGTEASDTISQWHARRSLQCGKVTRRTYDQSTGALSTTTEVLKSNQGSFGNALASTLEDYQHEPPLEHDDLEAHEALMVNRAQVKEQRTKDFAGEGSVRSFYAGSTFTLIEHPVHDQDDAQDRRFILTRIEIEAVNNLPKTLKANLRSLGALAQALGLEAGQTQDDPLQQPFTFRFECLRAGIPILPEELPFPHPGLQTATVVGPGTEVVHTDALGRIKVRFHGTRPEEHPEAGASGTDKDSFWIRLLQPWSSQGMGGNFLPRVGDEVVVSFLANDPDKPVIMGVLPSEPRKPGRFSEASSLPGDRALSGLRSRMHGGIAGNELLFDDTPREIRTRLASDHAATALNLGFNVHPRRNASAEPRGEGAELRTDASVAIRGGAGVFISADGRPGANSSQLSRDEALGHLGAALELVKTAGDLGGKHGMDSLEAQPQADLLKSAEDWEKGSNADPKAKGGKSPIFLASAPAGMALSSGDDTTVQAASNLDLVAMRHVQLSAGKRMLFHALETIGLFAHKLGMKLIAASGDVSIQAQDGLVELIAAKVLRLMSVGGPIELDSAEGIILRSGGAFLELKDGAIKAGGTGDWTGQFARVSWAGPSSQDAQTRSFGKSATKSNEFFRILQGGDPLIGIRYEIALENGQILVGRTDGDGRTEVAVNQLTQRAKLKLFPDDVDAE